MLEIVKALLVLIFGSTDLKESFVGRTDSHIQTYYLGLSEIRNMFLREASCQLYLSQIDIRTWNLKTNGGAGLETYLNYMSTFSPSEKGEITKCVKMLPPSRLLQGTWKFAKTSGNIELGMPYTLGDVIFLPPEITFNNEDFYRILCHERIHILQRQYRNEFNQFITRNIMILMVIFFQSMLLIVLKLIKQQIN